MRLHEYQLRAAEWQEVITRFTGIWDYAKKIPPKILIFNK